MDRGARLPEEPSVPQFRLDALLEDLQEQVERVRGTQNRVHTLLEAVLAIGSDLDLDVVLRQIVESAVQLVDCRYGALGVLGDEGGIKQFITVGIDEETIARIGNHPRGEGILGLLIREPHALRLPVLSDHPDSVGFPPGHPPMTTFLGTPVQVRGKIFGNLYLTEKHGGTAFDAEDEAVLRTLGAAAGVAIDNARLYDDARRRERWLAASSELTRTLLSGVDPTEVLHAFTATVRELSDADLVTLALPVTGTTDLVIESAEGRGADQVRGLALPDGTSLAAKVFASGERIVSTSLSQDPRTGTGSASVLDLGPAFVIPLGTQERVRGVLQVANRQGGTVFPDATVEMIAGFAGHAALALEIAEHRRDAEQLLVLNDRDRIARDLHDLAIQRLFAGGLSLQSVLNRLADRPDVAARVQRVVDDLDDTIKVVRSTIYALRESDRAGATGLRARLVTEVGHAAETLGFAPALRMSGLLDTDVSDEQRDHLLAVVREALSNAARHAHATAVEVTAEATPTTLRLRVADNGRGIGPDATRRSGLGNLRTRAENLGGACALTANEPSGTVLEWTVPLRPADPA
ncbi:MULTISPECIES: GAF domain-containing protein [unclassified Streptomyces]|uniref:GAF domain-containing sensor histidine kinase n=1 Tax=unclassified Streptomyces TaxID=2593676 RepID=UPI00224EA6C5|nr:MULTISPECIES: GAF domain-containing protein [unclassified Streptomyces]MCX4987201.1 GAF domain-containing protein [Streptomyces sp. NBC_00568]MCX5007667.1 GAF domain-containing protein [Streptomyces sp. NBC_00638]